MKQRIRYDDQGNNIFMSRQTYGVASGSNVVIVIDKSKMTFEIIDIKTKLAIVSGGDTKNYVVLLRKSKRALEHLGVTFAEEIRNRDFGVRLKETAQVI